MTTRAPRPTSIRIFLADGVPEGLRIVEKSNWTGRAVVASRAQIDRALARVESIQDYLSDLRKQLQERGRTLKALQQARTEEAR